METEKSVIVGDKCYSIRREWRKLIFKMPSAEGGNVEIDIRNIPKSGTLSIPLPDGDHIDITIERNLDLFVTNLMERFFTFYYNPNEIAFNLSQYLDWDLKKVRSSLQ